MVSNDKEVNPIKDSWGNQIRKSLLEIERTDVVSRVWNRDYTLWGIDPVGISDRLGWLSISKPMLDQKDEIQNFSMSLKKDGYRTVVVLGMGGSTIGAELFRRVAEKNKNHIQLIVLDSIIPETVNHVLSEIDLSQSLFVVASKSGTTLETMLLYRLFRNLLENNLTNVEAGNNFVAITDPGTELENLAIAENFKRIYHSPSDVSGRYSIHSYFALLPAAMVGLNIHKLLSRTEEMKGRCAASTEMVKNPAAVFGTTIAKMAMLGRDKLTIMTSPCIDGFGLWAEQLIAESLGKDGKGVIPIVGEPMVDSKHYGSDRNFVYVRVTSDHNERIDAFASELERSGQPVTRLELDHIDDLGAQCFLWQLSVVIAATILRINPFNQPDVQQAKQDAMDILSNLDGIPNINSKNPVMAVRELLENVGPGGYLGILAYLPETDEITTSINTLRENILIKTKIPTSIGFGPRFLHSTGQLHKGGPSSGSFLQITTPTQKDFLGSNLQYTFGEVIEAQTLSNVNILKSKGRNLAVIELKSPINQNIIDLSNKLFE